MIDVICTSMLRYDLLERTITSFLETNTFPINKFIVREDSWSLPHFDFIDYGVEIYSSDERGNIGQVRSLDLLMSLTSSEYVLTLEDDWECIEDGGIEEAICILDKFEDCASVSLRGNDPISHNRHPFKLINGVNRMMNDYHGWSGWSYAPSVRRRADYRIYNDIATFDKKRPWEAEKAIGNFLSKNKFNATTSIPYFRHIGGDRSTFNMK